MTGILLMAISPFVGALIAKGFISGDPVMASAGVAVLSLMLVAVWVQ